ncbi:hypothetical protein SAMN05428989_0901 [Pseudoxanthomonas sp. GM95]|uniref:hypothetical protein n=1 Tax=Pseudoxanthomonas sp. GM95 TaxID=1881043 RepID=UPI0008C94C48|nr:hypothetical protein [Pseudoxanthomonas sp. GM95]SEK83711.1 hypothetical protein SAMN05428989_0901 [Pseudoxanthomonas sp. GM95]
MALGTRDGTRHDGTAWVLLLLLGISATAPAAEARRGVNASGGEIVLLRDVSARPAYRPAPPGVALIVNPSPQRELAGALGTRAPSDLGELSDEEYAAFDSGASGALQVRDQTTVERMTRQNLAGPLGTLANGDGGGNTVNQMVGGVTGSIGGATRGVADQVTGALAQFPMMGGSSGPGGN